MAKQGIQTGEQIKIMVEAFKRHLETLLTRGKRDREPRASKWERNRLTWGVIRVC